MNAIWFSGVKAGRKINPESNCWYVPNVPPHPYLPFSVPPADRPPLMAVTPGVEDGRVYFICSGPIGGLFVFLQTSVGRSGTIPVFIPLSVKAAHIPWVSFARFCVKVMLTCSDGVEYSSIFDTDINNDKRFKSNTMTVNPRKYSDPNIFAEVLSCKMKAEFFYLCLLFFFIYSCKVSGLASFACGVCPVAIKNTVYLLCTPLLLLPAHVCLQFWDRSLGPTDHTCGECEFTMQTDSTFTNKIRGGWAINV